MTEDTVAASVVVEGAIVAVDDVEVAVVFVVAEFCSVAVAGVASVVLVEVVVAAEVDVAAVDEVDVVE